MFCGSSVGRTCRGWLISYSLVSYSLKLGIWLWTECVCLCIWNISLLLLTCFCSWVLQLKTQVLMLVVSLCKPVICKLRILGVGNLNIINQWGEPQKGWTKFWNFSRGNQKLNTWEYVKHVDKAKVLNNIHFKQNLIPNHTENH